MVNFAFSCGNIAAVELARDRLATAHTPPLSQADRPGAVPAQSYADYVRKYGGGRCEVLLLGMNPGPFGMVQTGVPFGDVVSCSQWMDVLDWAAADPGPPLPLQHPKRPLLGQRCSNVERSGQRLWSLAKNRWDAPEEFFRRFWVHNYCPLAFVKQSKNGTNFTPDKLSKEERRKLEAACDELLKETIEVPVLPHAGLVPRPTRLTAVALSQSSGGHVHPRNTGAAAAGGGGRGAFCQGVRGAVRPVWQRHHGRERPAPQPRQPAGQRAGQVGVHRRAAAAGPGR